MKITGEEKEKRVTNVSLPLSSSLPFLTCSFPWFQYLLFLSCPRIACRSETTPKCRLSKGERRDPEEKRKSKVVSLSFSHLSGFSHASELKPLPRLMPLNRCQRALCTDYIGHDLEDDVHTSPFVSRLSFSFLPLSFSMSDRFPLILTSNLLFSRQNNF